MKKSHILLCALVIITSGCTTVPPKNINNACAIVQQYPNWYYDSLNAYKKWGVPISTQLAIIHKESHFIATAKTSMNYTFGFIPTGRRSTAYGYAQALDDTWQHYQRETGNTWASRSNFSDAVDFIGWYGNRAHRLAGISKSNTYELYLAYHQGIAAYKKGSYRNKKWLIYYANQAQKIAYQYSSQLRQCKFPAKSWW